MANSDKNIVITPNIGQTDDPKIVFSGANTSVSAQDISVYAYPTDNGTLSFEGSAGQLFSITNSLSGTIFSVNDVSGIPSIEVDDTGTIRLAEFSGNVLIGTATDDGTNKLQVNGNFGVNGTAYAITGTTFDPPGTGGTDTSTTAAFAFNSGAAIVGVHDGYIRNMLSWTSSSDITIGAGGTSLIGGINLIAGSSGNVKVNGQRVFAEDYHPNADKWTTARTITLGGVLSGSVSLDGSGNVTLTAAHTSDPVITLTGAVTGSGTMTNLGSVSIATTATADPTLTLAGDATGSATFTNLGNATLTVAVANDSHTHDTRYYTETESDARFVRINTGQTWTATGGNTLSFRSLDTMDTASADQAALEVFQDTVGADAFMQFHVNGDYAKYFGLHGGVNDFGVGGWSAGAVFQRMFHDGYHPNADTWTTARTLSLTGAVTGSVSIDGSGNVSLATTATSDPTLTLAGDATGSATFTNLGNATLTVAVVDDSHSHSFNNLLNKTSGTGNYTTTGTFTAATFNATSTTNGGFQGIDADTALLPSFTWTSDQNTGMWHAGTDQIGFTTGGTNRLTLSTTGLTSTVGVTAPTATIDGLLLEDASDRSGLLEINRLGTTSWTGIQAKFSATGLWSLMGSETQFGLYDDAQNEWILLYAENAGVNLYYNAAVKLSTTNTGATTTGTHVADTFNATSTTGGGFQGIDADSATVPSFTWTADLNTGMYRPGADQIGWTTAGVNRLTLSNSALTSTVTTVAPTFNATSVTSGGFQGIDADSITAPSFTWTSDLNTGMWHPGADQIGFATGGVSRLNITTTAITTELPLTVTGDLTVTSDILPNADNTGNVGTAALTWSNGRFTNLTVDSTLTVRGAIDMADSDILRMGSSDDFKFYYDGSANEMEFEMEATCNQIRIHDNGTTRFTLERSTGNLTATGLIEAVSFYSSGTGTGTGFRNNGTDSASFPGFTWNNDDDTGMYRAGVNDVGFTTAGVSRCIINGSTATFSVDVVANSDIRLKKDIENIANALEKVNKLNGVNFTKTANDKRSTGLIAQDVQVVLPEAVSEDKEGYLSVAYGNMVGLLVEAIKEQDSTINSLRNDVETLKELVNKLMETR
jgi:hypothetical protein